MGKNNRRKRKNAKGKPSRNPKTNIVEENRTDSGDHCSDNQVVSREIRGIGIEGSNNSCYMDASLNSMFLFNEEFIQVLEKKQDLQHGNNVVEADLNEKNVNKEANDDQLVNYTETVNEILRDEIAGPLQTNKNLRLKGGKMSKFRSRLSEHKNSYSWDQMDSEEFISTLFGTILKAQGFYFIDGDDEGSYVFQTYADMTQQTIKTDVQKLLEYSFKDSQIQLASIPNPGFIIKMPVTDGRHMFDKIYPNPTINLRKLLKTESAELEPEMILSAVICLSGHHFTTFVREGKDKNSSSWLYLDSFSYSKAISIPNLDTSWEDSDCSQQHPLLKFLIENCYMCFYSPVLSQPAEGNEIET